MNKEAKDKSYIVHQDGVKGSKYGDNTFVSYEDMEKQVKSVLEKGYGKEWDGCMRSGKCCSYFLISRIRQEFYEKIDDDLRELWLTHYGVDDIKDLPDMEVGINHACSKLRARRTEEGNIETMCSAYENRPTICRDFTCGASKVRKKIMEKMIDE